MAPLPGLGVAPVFTAVPPPPVRKTNPLIASVLGELAAAVLKLTLLLLPPLTAAPPALTPMARRNPAERRVYALQLITTAAWEQAPVIPTIPLPGPGPVSAQVAAPPLPVRKINPLQLLLPCLRLPVLPRPPQPAGEI